MPLLECDTCGGECQARVRELESDNRQLRRENETLRRKLGASSWRIDGKRGEEFVAQLVGGTLTTGSAPYDLVSSNGVTFEIKCPNLNEAVSGQITNRWSWPHILGSNRGKRFHRLLLLGPTDPRYRAYYADPESPFVLFDVPFPEIHALLGSGDMIQISTAPLGIRNGRMSETRRLLFTHYEVTPAELVARYRRSPSLKAEATSAITATQPV
jgi:hypothetical protein